MVKTELDICNASLSLLGADSITSFEDGSTESDACKLHYLRIIDAALSMYNWSFAIKKETLAKSSILPTADWLNAFYLPADCLVVRSISGRSSAIGRDYAIIGKQLHCNESNVLLRYVHRVAPVDMPAFFEAYVVNKLASEMSNIITGSNTMTSIMRTITNEAFSIAKNTDALSQSPKTMPQSALVIKRRGW